MSSRLAWICRSSTIPRLGFAGFALGAGMLTEYTLDTGTVSINCAEGPKSGPTLVLVHGITARWQLFNPIIPALAERWHLVAMDLRGHGRSGHVPGQYRLLDYASDVLAL